MRRSQRHGQAPFVGMGILMLLVFWFAAGFVVRSWWVVPVPLLVGVAFAVFDFDFEGRLGDVLQYLGGDYEFWWTTYLVGAPFFMLAAGLGLQARRHLDHKRAPRALS
jgi:hypothetical protein